MVNYESQWLYDEQEKCCKTVSSTSAVKRLMFNMLKAQTYHSYFGTIQYFEYKLNSCMGSSSTVATGKYYPDWSGNSEGCLIDNSTTPAPEYMHASQGWFTNDLEKCCDTYYFYNKAGCMGSSAVGSEKYFVNWDTFKCVKDCPVGSGTDCGGLSDRDWNDEEFADKKTCCSTAVGWDYKNCMA